MSRSSYGHPATLVTIANLLAILHTTSPAQCGLAWQPGQLAGADRGAHCAIAWDPGSAGPATPVVVIGGEFEVVGTTRFSRVVAYDVAADRFVPLGAGLDGPVHNLRIAPNNDLYAVGDFLGSGGTPMLRIARFDGHNWQPIASSGPNGTVRDLAFLANGDLVVGGDFDAVGSLPAARVARWDGTNWSALGSGVTSFNPSVRAVAVHGSGDVYIGGRFTQVGGLSTSGIARWDGTNWHALGAGLTSTVYTQVSSLRMLPNGDVLAGGQFTASGPTSVSNVALWNGSTWTRVGTTNLPVDVVSLTTRHNGNLLAVGDGGLLEWNGTSWTRPVPGTEQSAMSAAVETAAGEFVAVGGFQTVGGAQAQRVARYFGLRWNAMVPGQAFDDDVRQLFVEPGGGIVAVGGFTRIGTLQAPGRARWDGATWQLLPPTPTPTSWLLAVGQLANGEVVFQDGIVAPRFLAWNGASWRVLAPSGVSGVVLNPLPIAGLANGDLVACVPANSGLGYVIGRWNGTTWTGLATTLNGEIHHMLGMRNGDLVIVGTFTAVDGVPANGIARLSGGQWFALGQGRAEFGNQIVHLNFLLEGLQGELYALGAVRSGTMNSQSGLWTGSGWQMLGQGTVGAPTRAVALPNGDLIAIGVGWLLGNPLVPMGGIARWDGTNWSPFGAGLGSPAQALALLPTGEVLVGGAFQTAGGLGSAHFARLASTCPATSTVTGTGCAGSAGTVTLQAQALPWLGSVAQCHATGLAQSSLAVAVVGLLADNVPLTTLHPAAGPTCRLLTTPDVAVLVANTQGTVDLQLAIPRDPAFVGVQLRQQILQVELGAGGSLAALSSSNALALTLGAF